MELSGDGGGAGKFLSQENKLCTEFQRDLYEDTIFSGDEAVIWSVPSK